MCHNHNTTLIRVLQSDRLAAGLTSLGVKKGDRVGIWAPNCIEWIIVQYATARAGFILVSNITSSLVSGHLSVVTYNNKLYNVADFPPPACQRLVLCERGLLLIDCGAHGAPAPGPLRIGGSEMENEKVVVRVRASWQAYVRSFGIVVSII